MTDTTQLLADLAAEADALADAIAEFGGDDLHAQAVTHANHVAKVRDTLRVEPTKPRAVSFITRTLDRVSPGDVVWSPAGEGWAEVEHVQDDLDLAGRCVKVTLFLADEHRVEGKPGDAVKVAATESCMAEQVDAYLDNLHEREAELFEAEAL